MRAIADLLVGAALLAVPPQENAASGMELAQSSSSVARVFAACRIVPGVKAGDASAGWGIDFPTAEIIRALGSYTDAQGFGNDIAPTIKLYAAPKSGRLSLETYTYTPEPGFQGTDTAIFSFQVRGKTYLSMHKFIVSIPRDEKPLSPDCADAGKLSFVPEAESDLLAEKGSHRLAGPGILVCTSFGHVWREHDGGAIACRNRGHDHRHVRNGDRRV
jgi:hypothetical protein